MPSVWPFKWKLPRSTILWCSLLRCTIKVALNFVYVEEIHQHHHSNQSYQTVLCEVHFTMSKDAFIPLDCRFKVDETISWIRQMLDIFSVVCLLLSKHPFLSCPRPHLILPSLNPPWVPVHRLNKTENVRQWRSSKITSHYRKEPWLSFCFCSESLSAKYSKSCPSL